LTLWQGVIGYDFRMRWSHDRLGAVLRLAFFCGLYAVALVFTGLLAAFALLLVIGLVWAAIRRLQ
jgi:hypothetical protein